MCYCFLVGVSGAFMRAFMMFTDSHYDHSLFLLVLDTGCILLEVVQNSPIMFLYFPCKLT